VTTDSIKSKSNQIHRFARQGWVFAMAKSIFARTVEKTGKKPVKTGTYKIVQKHPNWGN